MIAKLLKNEGNFRDEASLDEMTVNELEFYSNVIPSYGKFLKESGGLEPELTAKFYFGFYGLDEGLKMQNKILLKVFC